MQLASAWYFGIKMLPWIELLQMRILKTYIYLDWQVMCEIYLSVFCIEPKMQLSNRCPSNSLMDWWFDCSRYRYPAVPTPSFESLMGCRQGNKFQNLELFYITRTKHRLETMDNLQHWPETQEHLKLIDLIFNILFNIFSILFNISNI